MYDHTVQGIRKHLLGRSFPNNLLYIGEVQQSRLDVLSPKMDHLVCFIGGTFAIGATQGLKLTDKPLMTQSHIDDLDMGKDITRTCYEMYNTTATGLASEIVYFSTKPDSQSDILIKPLDKHNLLRPETMESLFVLWRITGDPIYRYVNNVFTHFIHRVAYFLQIASGAGIYLKRLRSTPNSL